MTWAEFGMIWIEICFPGSEDHLAWYFQSAVWALTPQMSALSQRAIVFSPLTQNTHLSCNIGDYVTVFGRRAPQPQLLRLCGMQITSAQHSQFHPVWSLRSPGSQKLLEEA